MLLKVLLGSFYLSGFFVCFQICYCHVFVLSVFESSVNATLTFVGGGFCDIFVRLSTCLSCTFHPLAFAISSTLSVGSSSIFIITHRLPASVSKVTRSVFFSCWCFFAWHTCFCCQVVQLLSWHYGCDMWLAFMSLLMTVKWFLMHRTVIFCQSSSAGTKKATNFFSRHISKMLMILHLFALVVLSWVKT